MISWPTRPASDLRTWPTLTGASEYPPATRHPMCDKGSSDARVKKCIHLAPRDDPHAEREEYTAVPFEEYSNGAVIA